MENKEEKEVKGVFAYDKDSKRFHRYRFTADGSINGSIYVPKDIDEIPDTIVLEKKKN